MADDAVDLAGFQRRFLALVMAREDVAGALAARGLGPEDAAAIAAGDERGGPIERLDVYANMVFLRLRDALAEDFPKLRAAVGDERWEALAMDYLQARPPGTFAIRDVGAALPSWLASRGEPLADLAALEWARADVFDRADEPLLTLEALQALPPEGFAELPLRLVAAHDLVGVARAADEVWRRLQRGEPAGTAPAEPCALLVWRQGAEIRHRAVDDDEAEALARVREGTTFGALCEALAEGRDVEDAARLASQLVRGWLDAELLVATV